ncbi:T9SS type A sorting domain-containing protein [bacterium]|nr:T9SS type A sorting domain-containing protein [bacterium]
MARRIRYTVIALVMTLLSCPPDLLSQQYGIGLMPGSSITASDGSEIIITDGSLVNDGSFIAQGESTVLFNGNTIHEIGGAETTAFSNLTVNSTAGIGITGAAATVSRILLCNGLLETNGKMTLLSGVGGTALIDGAGTGTISGNVTMQRYLPTGFGYMYFSSPFTSAKVGELGDEAIEFIYRYDENRFVGGIPASGWVSYDNPLNTLSPMAGFAVNLGPDAGPLTLDITGEVSNGDMALTVYNNDHPYTHGFNLVGNPYPSPVDWKLINALNSNIDNAVYYFSNSETDQYGGTYITYINDISSDGRATNIIPSMQGFFVHVTDGAFPVEGRLVMNNSVRVNDLSHPFIKSAKAEQQKLIRLSACFSSSPETPDYTVIYFDNQATPEFDGQYDALKLLNTDTYVPSLFSLTPGASKLSINGMPPPGGKSLLVPLGIITRVDGTIKFRVPALDPSLATMKINLIDSVAGVKREIAQNSEYSVDLKAGDYTGRFFLKFAEVTTSVSRQTEEDPGILEATANDGILRLKISSVEDPAGSIRIYDLTGRMLHEEAVREAGYYEYPGLRSNGIYIITYRTGNITVSKKVALIN